MYLTIFGKPRYLGLVSAGEEAGLEKGDRILIESSRGVEIAVVAGEITERQEGLYRSIDNRQEGQPNGDTGLQNVTFLNRIAPPDTEREDENRYDEENALVTARQILSHHDLNIKLVDVEYMFDRKKLFLYFTSEQRVDFRAYVRDLAREFRTRIELRQIGVRDESKVVKGLGACGRVCCCSYWLQRFMPIGIKMVKEQNLALNPTKISGLCGRLMCCMSFEQENYRELWKKLPSHASKIKTEQGTWELTGVDLATGCCLMHGPGGNVSVPVAKYSKFKETILSGGTWSDDPDDAATEDEEQAACPFGAACGGCVPAPKEGPGDVPPAARDFSPETDPRRRNLQRPQRPRAVKNRPDSRFRPAETDFGGAAEIHDRRRAFRVRPAGQTGPGETAGSVGNEARER